MSNQLAVVNQNQIKAYSAEEVELIKRTVAKDATDLELKMFLSQCQRTGLDAITRQIYFIKNPKDGKVQVQTSIDGFRLIAERSDKYEGQTKPEWCGLDGGWTDIWKEQFPPYAARIGVYKKGFREALYAVAIFDEYAQTAKDGGLAFMWKKMPSLMISKVAESLALRKAFPNEMSGIYTQEEMAQASNEVDLKKDTNPHAAKNFQPDILDGDPTAEPSLVCNFGKNKGKLFKNIPLDDIRKLVSWVETAVDERTGKPVRDGKMATKYLEDAYKYLDSLEAPQYREDDVSL